MQATKHELSVITCDGCGVCCLSMGVPPFLQNEIETLPDVLRNEIDTFLINEPDRETSGKPCFWYDINSKKCKHHQHRPFVCEDFEIGSAACLNYRKQK